MLVLQLCISKNVNPLIFFLVRRVQGAKAMMKNELIYYLLSAIQLSRVRRLIIEMLLFVIRKLVV